MTDLPDLRGWLARHTAEDATLTLGRYEVKSLVDELQRLRQSNDRLRKQNRKVRSKVAALKGGEVEPDDDDGGE